MLFQVALPACEVIQHAMNVNVDSRKLWAETVVAYFMVTSIYMKDYENYEVL
jgi:hypothetical protein